MIILDAISQVRSMFKQISADNVITDRALMRELKNTAVKYIRQQINQRKLFASPNIWTPLDCIEMVEAPLSECCFYTSPCTVSRSKYKLPKISEGIYGLLVQGVWGLDKGMQKKSTRYAETTANRYSNYLKMNIAKRKKFFWLHDGYLYVSDPNVEGVAISAYFEEDVDPNLYSCQKDQVCPSNPLELEFKVPGYLVKDVLNDTYNTILQTYKRSKEDTSSDGVDTNQ